MTTTLTSRLAAIALTILAGTTLLVGAVSPAHQGSATSAVRVIA